MPLFPPLPRLDPDLPPAGTPPLATAGWERREAVLDGLQYDLDWTDPATLNPVLLGQITDDNGQRHFIGFDDDRHVVTVAGSRAGKGDGLIIPNLLTYRGSVICIDPKGENAAVTAAWRAQKLGQQVYVLDPFRVAQVPPELRASFNPLDALDLNDPELVEDVAALAEAMIIPGDAKDAHWDETARAFIKGVLLWLLDLAGDDKDCRSFDFLRELLTRGMRLEDNGYSLPALLKVMEHSAAGNGAVAAAGAMLNQMGEQERGSVLSTVRRNTEFLESLGILESLQSGGSLDPAALKQNPQGMTIYLVLPEWRFATHARWLRMLLTSFLHSLQRTPRGWNADGVRPLPAVLFVLEEFAALGRMPAIEKAAGYIAGFGVKLWPVLQDLNQLKAHYEKSWETFIGNAGVLTAFGNVDTTTLDYLSKRLGKTEVSRVTGQFSRQGGGTESRHGLGSIINSLTARGGNLALPAGAQSVQESWSETSNYGQQLHTVPLLQPDEIARYFGRRERNMPSMMLALLALPVLPIRLEVIRASQDPFFQSRAAANPFHPAFR